MASTRQWQGGLIFLFALLLTVVTGRPALAENVNVTIGVGDTAVLIKGSTSPSALVTYMDGNTVIGSSAASSAGNYSQQFTNQTPGIHTYKVFAQDSAGSLTDTVSVVVNVAEHSETEIDIFLPPTLRMADSEITQGQELGLNGSTFPGATIVIYIDGTQGTAATDASGNWSYAIQTAALKPGSHQVYVQAIKSGGSQSHPSQARTFTVLAPHSEQPSGGGPQGGQPPSLVPSAPGVKRPGPPAITVPRQGEVVNGTTIEVRGTAEPGTQIELWNRGRVVGSIFTDASGHWRLHITLSEFANRLKARACRGGICSDFSATIQFFRQLSGEQKGIALELERYRLRSLEQDEVPVVAHIKGGNPPYHITIDWGDERRERLPTTNVRVLFSHIYKKTGTYNGSVTVADEQNQQAKAEFSVEVTPRSKGLDWQRFLWVLLVFLLLLVGVALWWTAKRRLAKHSK